MRLHGKTSCSSGSVGGRLAILLVGCLVAIAVIFGSRALAQSPEPLTTSTSTISTPESTSNSGANSAASPAAIIGAPSRLASSSNINRTPSAQSAPRPSSSATRSPAVGSPTDQQTVIAYLTDVINWYRHLGLEAQLVVEPNEMLYFAADRQVANDILNLAFDYARTQAKFIGKTTGQTTIP